MLINKPDSNVYVLANEIKLNHFNSHYESFSVDNSEEVVNRNCICNVDEFSGPLINITKMSSGQKNKNDPFKRVLLITSTYTFIEFNYLDMYINNCY